MRASKQRKINAFTLDLDQYLERPSTDSPLFQKLKDFTATPPEGFLEKLSLRLNGPGESHKSFYKKSVSLLVLNEFIRTTYQLTRVTSTFLIMSSMDESVRKKLLDEIFTHIQSLPLPAIDAEFSMPPLRSSQEIHQECLAIEEQLREVSKELNT